MGLISPARKQMNAVLKNSAFETWFDLKGKTLVTQKIVDFTENNKELTRGEYLNIFYAPDPALATLFQVATLAEVHDNNSLGTFERCMFALMSANAFRDGCENTTMSKPKELTGVVHAYYKYFVLGTDKWFGTGPPGVLLVREYKHIADNMPGNGREIEKIKADCIKQTKVAKAGVGGWHALQSGQFLTNWAKVELSLREGIPKIEDKLVPPP